jgi:hypothetical protein
VGGVDCMIWREDNINMNFKEIAWEGMYWINLAQD